MQGVTERVDKILEDNKSTQGEDITETEVPVDSEKPSTPETSSKGFLSQLEKAKSTDGSGDEQDKVESPKKDDDETQNDQKGSESPGEQKQERRARRSSSRDRRPERRSGSKDRLASRSSSKERKPQRSSSRDAQRSRSRDRTASSRRDLGSSTHSSGAGNARRRSKSGDRRAPRRTASAKSADAEPQDLAAKVASICEESLSKDDLEKSIESPTSEEHNTPPSTEDSPKVSPKEKTEGQSVDPTDAAKGVDASDSPHRSKDRRSRHSSSKSHHHGSSKRSSSRDKRPSRRSHRKEGEEACEKDPSSGKHSDSRGDRSKQKSDGDKVEETNETVKRHPKPEDEKQTQTVSVVFRDKDGNVEKPKEIPLKRSGEQQAADQHQGETNPATDLLSHLTEKKSNLQEPTMSEDKDPVLTNPAEALLSHLGADKTPSSPPDADSSKNSSDQANSTEERSGPKEDGTDSPNNNKKKAVSDDVKVDASMAKEGDSDKKSGTEEMSEKDKRRAARKARRDKKHSSSDKSSNAPAADNMAALLGMIGSTEDDFKSHDTSLVADLFDSQPKDSVGFFQAMAAAPSGNVTKHESTENNPDDKESSNVASKKSSRPRDMLSQSDHHVLQKKCHPSMDSDNCSLPDENGKSSTRSKKIQHKSIVEEDDQEDRLPPPSLAGDAHVKKKSKSRKKSNEHEENDKKSSRRNGSTRMIRRAEDSGSQDDNICDESLAPPSLAGDMPQSLGRSSQKNPLPSLTETIDEETVDEADERPGLIRTMSKKGKSFRMLDCDDDDEEEDVFDDMPASNPDEFDPDSTLPNEGTNSAAGGVEEEVKRKKREAMMKTMKKATSALSVGGKKAGKGVAQKAKSARNVFEQATTKVFARRKEEGRGLLKFDEDD